MKAPECTDDVLGDFALLKSAIGLADRLMQLVAQYAPDRIYIEQTNGGRFRTSQKQLEFIHCAFLQRLIEQHNLVRYVDTSRWRSMLNIKLTKDQRKHNKLVKIKQARGKITPKHLAVIWANETYGLTLLKKDHDIADALCIATYGYCVESRPQVYESLDQALSPR